MNAFQSSLLPDFIARRPLDRAAIIAREYDFTVHPILSSLKAVNVMQHLIEQKEGNEYHRRTLVEWSLVNQALWKLEENGSRFTAPERGRMMRALIHQVINQP